MRCGWCDRPKATEVQLADFEAHVFVDCDETPCPHMRHVCYGPAFIDCIRWQADPEPRGKG